MHKIELKLNIRPGIEKKKPCDIQNFSKLCYILIK